MKTILQLSTFLLAFLVTSSINAQVIWEGNGDGTSWNDGANWSTGSVPAAADIAEILTDVTITGEIMETPMRIKTGAGATIKFHLDMDLDNEAANDHLIVIGAKCTVEFGEEGTPYNFSFNTASNKHGLLNNNSGDSSHIVIMRDATLNFKQHNNAINLLARHTTFENNGTINVSAQSTNGIRSGGLFTNNGVIMINETSADGIQVLSGVFNNGEEGEITTTKCGDDGIEIINEATLMNNGVINSTAVDEASSNKNALAVGTADTLGYYINGSTGTLNADGGTSDGARAIYVYEEGDLTNTGVISASGGNTSTVIYIRNVFLNDKNGYINLNDGRINANVGSLVNNGFIETARDGSGIFSTENAMVTNNAFFRYENSGQFASGDGAITDNGLNLNRIYRNKIDAGGACTVDIAEVGYDWTIAGSAYASSSDDGTFTFLPNSIVADSVVMKTSLPEVNIKVINICPEAIMTTSTQDENFDTDFRVYPTVLNAGDQLQIATRKQGDITATIYDGFGRLIQVEKFNGSTLISTNNWSSGQFIISLSEGHQVTSKQIFITK